MDAQQIAAYERHIADNLSLLLESYDQNGGSAIYQMDYLRNQFATWVPFNHPQFHRLFSEFATKAIERDARANRPIYANPPNPPNHNIPIDQTVPYVFHPTAFLPPPPPPPLQNRPNALPHLTPLQGYIQGQINPCDYPMPCKSRQVSLSPLASPHSRTRSVGRFPSKMDEDGMDRSEVEK
ncbi:hypothetical protein CROQUDRAFT_111499 [Cronartium quercuum f. sp. fusiforme G11]|uniref:Uncharacterized protein n=1 Tax=Cronartium quercuum f. sp. fusiforme G11 TaxID=708437 RepID=A0A9P6N989_9BASI|nr:hypothetical protein CROQUDRAFT_111499 [Cronartium quercuum f. sp. fusiforme G11]